MAIFWINDHNVLHAQGLESGSIEDSIAKWEILFDEAVAGNMVLGGGKRTCSLCLRYPSCIGCPIYEYTGLFSCRGTAYEHYYEACGKGDLAMAISAAEEMVEFLEMLLENGS